MTIIAGIDLGTTNCKAVAYTSEARTLASVSRDYPLRSPHSSWAEQDAREVWAGLVAILSELVGKLPAGVKIDGLCLSGAMHSLLPVDASGAPLAPALTWADQRAAPQAKALRKERDVHAVYLRTGCPVQAIYYPAKLRWWQEERPEIDRQAARYAAIKEYVLYRLTGRWVSDFGLASTTGLFDLTALAWDAEALSMAGIGPERLPEPVSPFATVAGLIEEAAQAVGLPAGLPVIAGSSDGALANLGAGAAQPGESVITVGTSGAVRVVMDHPLLDPLERTWCYVTAEGNWFAGGAINNGGLAMQWALERLYPELQGEPAYLRMLQDIAAVPPGAGGVMVLPYFTGERSPHWDARARAAITGLGLEHTRAHISRAVLEGVAYCLADVWQVLSSEEQLRLPVRLTGGITHSPIWMQIVADVLGVPLAVTEAADASVTGAAMMGLRALGVVESMQALAENVRPERILLPNPDNHAFYASQHQQFQELYQSLYEST